MNQLNRITSMDGRRAYQERKRQGLLPEQQRFSLLPSSPFRSDGEAWSGGAQVVIPDDDMPWMGTVEKEVVEIIGKHETHRYHIFRVRIACEHWAPNKDALDCRFGCERTKVMVEEDVKTDEALEIMRERTKVPA